MTPEQLDNWQALADAATPGPWRAEEYAGSLISVLSWNDAGKYYDGVAFHSTHEDATFIAAAREAVPALIEEVARLWERNAELEAERGVLRALLEMPEPPPGGWPAPADKPA